MVGVVGIGFGLWWADAAAAAVISLDITRDGVSNLRRAVVDLMDQAPTTVDGDEADPLRDELARMLRGLDWVDEVDLRLREEGQVYFGEALVVPSDATNITEKVEDALSRASDLDWRIQDLALTPVTGRRPALENCVKAKFDREALSAYPILSAFVGVLRGTSRGFLPTIAAEGVLPSHTRPDHFGPGRYAANC